mgnify:CR=1 FL=1
MTDTTLDARGLNCPLPVLKANRALRATPEGARLRVLATARASNADFQVFCRETRHARVAFTAQNGIYAFTIKRRADSPDTHTTDRS